MGTIVKDIIHNMGTTMLKTGEVLDRIIQLKSLKNDANLARFFNVRPNTLSNWRNRNTLPYDLIVDTCEHERWSLDYVLTGKETMKPGKGEPALRKKVETDYTYVPQVNGKISAGTGSVPDNVIEMRVAFRKEWIARKGNAKDMVLIKVSGDSMAPTLLNGDLVLIDRGRKYFEPQGGIYAIALDDAIMIKRVQLVGDCAKIISDNKMYEAFEVSADQVRVNGKVIWFARELEL